MKTKSYLIFAGGVVAGVVMTLLFLMVMGSSQGDSQEELVMFKQPKQEIHATLFEVRQVYQDDYALATIREGDEYLEMVLLMKSDGSVFYDGREIRVGKGQRALMVGTFRYTTVLDFVKTVPVVRIVNRK